MRTSRFGRLCGGALALGTMSMLGMLAAGCPLEVRELPGCRLDDVTCDDGNPCTEDQCDEDTGSCVFTTAPSGTDCGDGNACNGLERCDEAGACQAEPPLAIDDGDACTRDACDPATGVVSHDPIEGCGETFWRPLPEMDAPTPRIRHSAVWTGSEMIIWGGRVGPGEVTGSGARYDPVADSWTPVSSAGAPSARHSHSAVWTGNEMLVWGGFGETDYVTDGAIYDPVTDTWIPMASAGSPTGRTKHSTIWTGTEMIVWGGLNDLTILNDGARYAVGADTWTALPGGGPQPRLEHSAVWTGSQMIIWGGSDTFDWLNNGGIYDRTTDTWTAATSLVDAPHQRERASAVWAGDEMLIWGGWDGGNYLSDGAIYDVTSDTWTAITGFGSPVGRADHITVWTGDQMVVWGGCSEAGCSQYFTDGGRFDTDNDGKWIRIGVDPGLSERANASAVWTGTQVIVWGGENGPSTFLGDGARATIEFE